MPLLFCNSQPLSHLYSPVPLLPPRAPAGSSFWCRLEPTPALCHHLLPTSTRSPVAILPVPSSNGPSTTSPAGIKSQQLQASSHSSCKHQVTAAASIKSQQLQASSQPVRSGWLVGGLVGWYAEITALTNSPANVHWAILKSPEQQHTRTSVAYSTQGLQSRVVAHLRQRTHAVARALL